MPQPLRALLACAAVIAAVPVLPAGAAASPCDIAWTDPAGDVVVNTGTGVNGPAVPDDDLDARATRLVVGYDEIDVIVRVAHLDPKGPAIGTGHGVSLVVTKYGKTMVFAARKDVTHGDKTEGPDAASVVLLTADPAASTFTLTVRRADLARASGSPSRAGELTGIYVDTIRYDHAQAAVNATPLGAGHAGLTADGTAPSSRGGTLSLDDCDAARYGTTLRLAVSGPASRRSVTATLRDRTGLPLARRRLRLAVGNKPAGSATTDSAGTARFSLAGGRTVVVTFDGEPGVHAPATASVRL
jgi:hypothetical protein